LCLAVSRYRAEIPGEFYFMGFGALGVSLAGFAGLIAALSRRPAPDAAVAAYRIRTIVILGFMLTYAGFGTVALYAVVAEDIPLTARLASLFLASMNVFGLLDARPGPAWPDDRQRSISIVILSLLLAHVVIGSIVFLQVLLLGQLSGPVSIFYSAAGTARP
jgi:hypothetical protein